MRGGGRGYAYDMSGNVEASVERYLELSGQHMSSLKPVADAWKEKFGYDDHPVCPLRRNLYGHKLA